MTTQPDAPSWIRVADFEETSYWLTILNLTTHTPLKLDPPAEISEISENGMTLKLPVASCASGQLLMIDLIKNKRQPLTAPGKTEKAGGIQLTAKIMQTEPINDRFMIVSLQLYQFNEKLWKEFLKEFSERQTSVNLLVKKIAE